MNQLFRKPKRFTTDNLQRYSPRGLLLYFLPMALIPAALISLGEGHLAGILINSAGFTFYMLAAWCLRKGLQEEHSYIKSLIARPPRKPLKMIAAIITGINTGMIAWLGAQYSLSIALMFTGGAFLGMYLSYGFDPRNEKKIAIAYGYSEDETRQTLEDSSRIIRKIEEANDKIRNPELNYRIEQICEIADRILVEIASDSRNIRRVRKFLNVYLDGTRQVTEGYAKTHQQNQSGALEQNFRNVLETIESVFQEQHQKLLEENVFDLDVKIEVLTNQLKQEGIL